MTAKRPDGSYGPVHKATRWMGNSPGILARLTRKCIRAQHGHVHLLGGRAAAAARTLDQELNAVDW
eukprot:9142443-Heterocapsa_arctica.AAC.1